jgi:hypothetical protein
VHWTANTTYATARTRRSQILNARPENDRHSSP